MLNRYLGVKFLLVCFIGSLGWISNAFGSSFNAVKGVYKTGYILAHDDEISYLLKEPPYGIAMESSLWYDTSMTGTFLGEVPISGLGIYHGTLSNPQVFGEATAVYPYLKTNLIRINETWNVYLQLAGGLAYLSRKFSLENNRNIAIGSHLNLFFESYLEASVKLFQSLYFTGTAGFLHFSNGRLAAPNKGLNFVNTSLGLKWEFQPTSFHKHKPEVSKPRNNMFFSIIGAAGIKDYASFDKNTYRIHSLNVTLGHPFSLSERAGIGFDLFYDKSIKTVAERIKNEGSDVHFKKTDYYRLGVHGMYSFDIGRFRFPLEAGVYYFARFVTISNIYTRIGIRYLVTDHLFLNATLKSHKFNADFVEFGVGYQQAFF